MAIMEGVEQVMDILRDAMSVNQFISFLSISVSSVSLLCEVFLIFTYIRFNQLRPFFCWLHPDLGKYYDAYGEWTASYCRNLRFTERHPLYLHIAIANGLRDFAKLLGNLSDGSYLCVLQGFMVNYGGLASFWWIQTIGWVMYSAIFHPKLWRAERWMIAQRERLMIGTNYGLPLLISALPLLTGSYGNVGHYCWITESTETGRVLRWLCFYVHLLLIIACCALIYTLIGRHIKNKEFGALFQRIRWYPLCLIFGFGFALLRGAVRAFIDFGGFGLWGQIVHAITTGSFGVFVFVLVGRSRGSFKLTKEDNDADLAEVDEVTVTDGFRAAIFGLSDGLATNLCLILGVQFAQQSTNFNTAQIITSGVAGLFGGAISMAIGEYVSVKAQSEAAHAEIAKHSVLLQTEWASQMNALRDALRDIDVLSRHTVEAVVEDLKKAEHCARLRFFSILVLGVDPDADDSAIAHKAALYSFGMFSFGALIPLSPYFWFDGRTACFMAIATSLAMAVMIGAAIAYFTRSRYRDAVLRQFVAVVVGVSASIAISKLFNA